MIEEFIRVLIRYGYTSIDTIKFRIELGSDDSLESSIEEVLKMDQEKQKETLDMYCKTSDMYAHEMQNMMINNLRKCVLFVPEQPEIVRPNPVYPMWRGHKASKRKYR